MRPTRFGLKALAFYLAMVMAFYAMPYSNPFFLLLGFLTLIGLVGIVGAHRNLRGINARFAAPEPIRAGSTARVPVDLQSGSPRFQITAHLELASGEQISGNVAVLTGAAHVALESPALARGCYPIERAFVETRHPFGLVRCRSEFPIPADASELIVYPSPLDALEGRTAANSLEDLDLGGDASAGDLQPASLRDHREGDGERGIHWRASARRGKLVVQEWEGGRGQGLEVLIDRRCDPAELEKALATVSAIVELARTNKETLRIHSQGLSATYGEGGAPWIEALRFLASTAALPAGGPPPPAASPSVVRLPRRERGAAHAA